MRVIILCSFLALLPLKILSLEIDLKEKEEEKFASFLANSSLNFDSPRCENLESELKSINPNLLEEYESHYELTKIIVSKVCSNNQEAEIEFDKFILEKINFEDSIDYLNYFLYLRHAINPYIKTNNLNKIEEIYRKAFETSFDFGRKNNIDILVTRPLISMAKKLCNEGYFQFCLKIAEELESKILDVFKIPEVIKRNDNTAAAAYSLKTLRIQKIQALTNLGQEYKSSLLSELKNFNDVFFYGDPKNNFYKELFLEYESYLKDNFPKDSFSMLESLRENLVIDISKDDDFFDSYDFVDLAAAYIKFSKKVFPKEQYENFKKYSLIYLERFTNQEDQAMLLSALLTNEMTFYGRDSALSGEVCKAAKEKNLMNNVFEIDFTFVCSSQSRTKKLESYLTYISKIEKDNLNFEDLWVPFASAPLDLAIQMQNFLNERYFVGETFYDGLIFLINQTFFYFSDRYKEKKLADDWYRFIEESLKIVPYNTEVSLRDGSARFLAYIYKYINPTFLEGDLSYFLKPSKIEKLNEIIEQRFIFNPEKLASEIEKITRDDLKNYHDSLLMLIKNYYYHVNAIGLISEKEDSFDEFYSGYKETYGFGGKVWCGPKIDYENCYPERQREGLIYLSRHGSDLLFKLNKKIQTFTSEEKQSLRQSSVPELFNRNIYDKSYKNIRHWILFLMDLYYERSLHDEGFSAEFNNKKKASDERLASLFIQNISLENYSRIQNAFQKNKVLKKYNGTEFAEKIISYENTLNDYLRLKESLVNYQPSSPGGKSLDGAQTRLLNLASLGRKKFDALYYHTGNILEPVFKSADFKVGEINLTSLQKILGDDDVLFITSYAEDSPGISLFLSKYDFYLTFGEKRDVMSNRVQAYTKSINSRGLNDDSDLNEFNLSHAKLIKPIGLVESKNENRKKVYVISDDNNFQRIPFSALYDEDEDEWAFKKYDFVYLDSLGSFVLSKERKKIKLNKNLNFTAFANPDFKGKEKDTNFKNLFANSRGSKNQELLENLSGLPETEDEVIEISKNFVRSNIYLGKNASEENLKKVLKNPSNSDILSFATHAFSDVTNYTLEHGFAFSPPSGSENQNDGFLTSQEIRNLNLNDSMVVLSACDTDKPLIITQDTYSGFIRSFIEAGAKTVLYTSWNIDSESAKIFMTETFKTGVALNLQISEAISSTMEKFERGDFGEKYRHPFYWAPYKVFGVD
jgi:CHAT domain-containing protein